MQNEPLTNKIESVHSTLLDFIDAFGKLEKIYQFLINDASLISNYISQYQAILNEYKIMRMFDHQNILKAIDIVYDYNKCPSIIYEECPQNLMQLIQNKPLSKLEIVLSIYQIANVMKFIHSQKVIHINLKPSNILVSEDGTIKISNFKNAEINTNGCKAYDDIRSFGAVVFFILSGIEIDNSDSERIFKTFPMIFQQLIGACLCDDVSCIPTFETICEVLEQNKNVLLSFAQQESESI